MPSSRIAQIKWTLQPKQYLAFQCPSFEGLYGGAAGGGKTDFLLYKGLYTNLKWPGSKSIILRRTYPELEQEIIPRTEKKFVDEYGYKLGKYNRSEKVWEFPNKSLMFFRHSQKEKDIENYQGGEYDFVGFDELTKFTQYQYEYMRSRTRSTVGSVPSIWGATNPGGIGHGWVKIYFNVDDRSMKIRKVLVDGAKNLYLTRCFIPSLLYDNKILMEKNPLYELQLKTLPPKLRQALLDGNWNVFEGQAFEEFINAPELGMYNTHVIEPFQIPADWPRYRSFDFGYSRPFSVGWWAVGYDGEVYRYRELYGCVPDQPNTGLKWEPLRIAKAIKDIEDKYEKGHQVIGIADPAIFDQSRGESIAMMMQKSGIFFMPGDNKRLAGKMQLHYRFAFDYNGRPGIYIFKNCKAFIRTIPELVYDDTNVEDIDTEGEDHVYDEVRYFLMEFKIEPKPQIQEKYELPELDPLAEAKPARNFFNM